MTTSVIILLFVLWCALFLCIGILVGMFMTFKIDKECAVSISNAEKEFFGNVKDIMSEHLDKTTDMIIDNQKQIAKWIDEIEKNNYVPIWKNASEELPECDGIYYGKKDDTNSMWKVIFRDNEWFLSGYPAQKMEIIKWTELY